MRYKILHLPTGTYIYRSLLGRGENGEDDFGQFYSEYEADIGVINQERYIKLYTDASILKVLMYEIHRMGGQYFSFQDNDPKVTDIPEHFQLEEVDDEI
jgi:hypothetical protein